MTMRACSPDRKDCASVDDHHHDDHTHGPDCGHSRIAHGDHFDYLVSGNASTCCAHLDMNALRSFLSFFFFPFFLACLLSSFPCFFVTCCFISLQVGNELHHYHDGHCDAHGSVMKRVLGDTEYLSLDSDSIDSENRSVYITFFCLFFFFCKLTCEFFVMGREKKNCYGLLAACDSSRFSAS